MVKGASVVKGVHGGRKTGMRGKRGPFVCREKMQAGGMHATGMLSCLFSCLLTLYFAFTLMFSFPLLIKFSSYFCTFCLLYFSVKFLNRIFICCTKYLHSANLTLSIILGAEAGNSP